MIVRSARPERYTVLEDANAETYLWRPQDFDFIVDRLQGNDV